MRAVLVSRKKEKDLRMRIEVPIKSVQSTQNN